MAESFAEETEHLGIKPYQFEPTEMNSNDDSDYSESDFDNDQASFTSRLGRTLWRFCTKYSLMPRAVECFCCKELEIVSERLERSDSACVNNLKLCV